MSIKDFFSKKKEPSISGLYVLVEYEIDDDTFRQGIQLKDPRFLDIIVTIHPKVQVREVGGSLKISFDFDIESNPNKIEVSKEELRSMVGDVIVDLIKKDYNA